MNLNQNEIPKSIIKGSGVILGKPLHPTKGLLDVIYLGDEIGIFGLQKCPYFMFATHSFNENILPSNVLLDLHKLRELYLRPTFSKSNIETTQYVTIPNWITNFKELELLKLDHINVDNLFVINVLNIKHLILSDVEYTDKEKLKLTIEGLKGLEEISYDKSLQSFVDEIMQETTVKFTYNTP